MGYHIHHSIVVTSWEKKHLGMAHEKAVEIFPQELVSEIQGSIRNGYKSFFVAPDGSKEGWKESDEMDVKRREFMKWAKAASSFDVWIDAVEVAFGGDEGELNTRVVSHNEENEEGE